MTQPIDFGPFPNGTKISNYLYPNLDAEELHQDMVTIVLPTGYSIYVDWFPEYSAQGEFWIRAAWSSGEIPPIKAKSLSEVRQAVRDLVDYFKRQSVSRTGSGGSKRILELSV